MINNTGQKLFVMTEQDGEVIFKVNEGESFNIRSVAQTANDKYYSPNKIYIKGKFTKVMDRNEEIIEKLGKNYGAYVALHHLVKYLVPNYNVVMKNGKKYKLIDLANAMGISRQMAGKYIAQLKEIHVLSEIETNKGICYAINPNYYLRGETANERVIKLFEKQ